MGLCNERKNLSWLDVVEVPRCAAALVLATSLAASGGATTQKQGSSAAGGVAFRSSSDQAREISDRDSLMLDSAGRATWKPELKKRGFRKVHHPPKMRN